MDAAAVRFTAPLRIWHSAGEGSAAFVLLPADAADIVAAHALARRLELGRRRGFGSVKVTAQVGATRWSTSLFPQKDGSWFLPVRKMVCEAERLDEGAPVEAAVELL